MDVAEERYLYGPPIPLIPPPIPHTKNTALAEGLQDKKRPGDVFYRKL